MSAPALAAAPGAAVEVATWRPVEVVEVDGWQVGFAGGFTRRANSAVPVAEPDDVETAIARVEALYGERDLPARFRVCSAARPSELDHRLAARGYRAAANTHVLVRDLTQLPGATTPVATSVEVAAEPDDAWLSGWLGVKAAGTAVDPDLARAVVGGSSATYVTATDAAGVVGVIRAAAAGTWVGLSCLMVAPRARRRGLGRALTVVALDAASGAGAERAFLQVEAGNRGAAALYEDMGFQHAETYHYRER